MITDKPSLEGDDVDSSGIEMNTKFYEDIPVKLGRLPTDPVLIKELERSIKDDGWGMDETSILQQELEKIKNENVADSPSRDDIPLPPR